MKKASASTGGSLIRDLTVNQQITIGFALVLALLILCGGFGFLGADAISRNAGEVVAGNRLDAELAQREVDHLNWAGKVSEYLADERLSELRVETDPRKCGFGQWYYGEGRRQAEQLVPSLAPLLQRIEKPHNDLHASAVAIQQTAGDSVGRLHANAIFLERSKPALAGVQGLLHQIRAETKDRIMSDQVMLAAAAATKLRIGILALIALGVGLVISRLLAVRLTSILGRAATDIQSSSTQVAAASEEISAGSQVLSDTASEQASVAEETSSSLEQISAQSQQTASLTQGSAELMKENIKKSGQSLKALAALTQNMTDIERDSGQIRSIIATIDSIAFQTNLLALNAAVEAARAGEAGAGFAVVADEVKNLAMKTAQEANRIQQLLDATVARITSCAGSLKAINNDFDDIVETATMIGEKNDAISEATAQQSKGIEQISAATNESADATQRIAATAEESAAASTELSAQSEELQAVVASLEKLVYGRKAGRRAAAGEQRVLRIGHDQE